MLQTTLIIKKQNNEKVHIRQNAAAIYIASLGSESGRRTMTQVLNLIVNELQTCAYALTLEWGALRFQHVAAIRSNCKSITSLQRSTRH